MAGVNLQYLILKDNWPGQIRTDLGIPDDGFDATRWNDTTVAGYTPGTKIQAWSDNTVNPGKYTMLYVGIHCLSAKTDVSACLSASYGLVQHACNSVMYESTNSLWSAILGPGGLDTGYKDGTILGQVGFICSSITGSGELTSTHASNLSSGESPARYAWIWVGGVCPPIDDITMFNSEFSTNGSIAAGQSFCPLVDTSVLNLGYGDISQNVAGWSMKADA